VSDALNFCTACGGVLKKKFQHPNGQMSPYYQCVDCYQKNYNNPTVGVAVIYIRSGRILLGKRKSSYRDNLWCIPCGHLDAFEPVIDGAKREFKEETSLVAHDLDLYAANTNPNNTVVIYYKAQSVTGTLQANDDLSEVGYFRLDGLPNMAFASDLTIINQLKSEQYGR